MSKALLVALVALVALASTVDAAFIFTDDEIDSEEGLWDLFGRWAAYHEVVREPGRFAAFKANVQWRRSKSRHSGSPMSLNLFDDQSFDEFAANPCVKEPEEPEVIDVVRTSLQLRRMMKVQANQNSKPLVEAHGAAAQEQDKKEE